MNKINNNLEIKYCEYFQCDLSKEAEIKNAFEKIIKEFGVINVLVNNAAFFQFGKIEDVTE